MPKKLSRLLLLIVSFLGYSQVQTEIIAPYNIKTICFVQDNQVSVPIFKLGTGFQLQFDDLYASETFYSYEIIHCDYNWEPSQMGKNEYIDGLDNQPIQQHTNSNNTLQLYTHYMLGLPNRFTTRLKLSGNYIIKILDNHNDLVFSRKFMLYEDIATVSGQVKQPRTIKNIQSKQNLEFAINSTLQIQNPLENIKTVIFQNANFKNSISNVYPQYTLGNKLYYNYDTETQFWGGNEYRFFENKFVRVPNNSVSKIDFESALYNTYLYPTEPLKKFPYTYAPDINGSFRIINAAATNSDIESDYTWVHFSLSAKDISKKQKIYIQGLFNNFQIDDENLMEYNPECQCFEKALLLKQGFYNYKYNLIKNDTAVDYENDLDGNFFVTENQYKVLVYYKSGIDRFWRLIGVGDIFSVNITN
jgi:hypothetical protein